MNPIEKYVEEQGYILAKQIDDNMALVIKPKPWYCPMWLYRKIIADCVEVVKTQSL